MLARLLSKIYKKNGIVLIDSEGQKYICGKPDLNKPVTLRLLNKNLNWKLILNPDLRFRKKSTKRIKRFVAGLILDTAITRPLTETKVEKMFGKLGGLEVEEGTLAADMPDRVSKAQTTVYYRRLKNLVGQYQNYRTFDRRECLKRRVYLEVDYNKIPKDTLDKFAKEMEHKYQKIVEGKLED